MSVRMSGRYLGQKRVEMLHEDSGATLTTTAPKDNQGDGLGFSPTDLVAAALGACMLTILAIAAERDGLDLTGARVELVKQMVDHPRRIGRIEAVVHLPARLADAAPRLEAAALGCPVARSLHPDLEAHVRFVYDA